MTDFNSLFNNHQSVPYALFKNGSALKCKWVNVAGKSFTEPFFSETVGICRHRRTGTTAQVPYVSGLDEMFQTAAAMDAVTPATIIFHLSRCGSTLISQAFATSERFVILSEVPFFDELLCLPLQAAAGTTETTDAFSAALRLYGAKRNDKVEHVIIKTDCWHIFFYETLRSLFPTVPFVIMYRRPDEVFRSLNQVPGRQIIPHLVSPEIFGFPGMPDPYQKDIYTAAVIEKMLAKFIAIAKADQNTLLVNYNEGPITIVNKIAAFSNINLEKDELVAMDQRTRYHSKRPEEDFKPESLAVTPFVLHRAIELYAELDRKRKGDK